MNPRQVTLRGVHLGMGRAEVESSLIAEGFSRTSATSWGRYPDTSAGEAHETILIGYHGVGEDEALSIVHYTRSWRWTNFDEQFGTDEARRAEVRRLLAADPQVWTSFPGPPQAGNHFAFAVNQREARRLTSDRLKSCFWAWDCVSVRDGVDCRPVVDRAQGAVIEGEYRMRAQLTIEMFDYDQFAGDLMRDPAFRERDLEGRDCPTFYVGH